jgi:hypothetical protein
MPFQKRKEMRSVSPSSDLSVLERGGNGSGCGRAGVYDRTNLARGVGVGKTPGRTAVDPVTVNMLLYSAQAGSRVGIRLACAPGAGRAEAAPANARRPNKAKRRHPPSPVSFVSIALTLSAG